MKKIISVILVVLLFTPQCALAIPLDVGIVYNPNGGGATLYTEKSENSEQLGLFYNGNDISIYENDGEWAYVRFGIVETKYEGYMLTNEFFVSYRLDDPPVFRHNMEYASLVGSNDVKLLYSPGKDVDAIGRYLSGTVALVRGEVGDWFYVSIGELAGFVRREEVVFNLETEYADGGYPIIPNVGYVWLDTTYNEIVMYPFTIYEEPSRQKTEEMLRYIAGRFELIADLGDWYYINDRGYLYYVESKYFLENGPDTAIITAP